MKVMDMERFDSRYDTLFEALERGLNRGLDADVAAQVERIRAVDRYMAGTPDLPVPATLAQRIVAAAGRAQPPAKPALSPWQTAFVFGVCAALLVGLVLGLAALVGASGLSVSTALRALAQAAVMTEATLRAMLNIAGALVAQPVFWIAACVAFLLFDASLTVAGAVAIPSLRRSVAARAAHMRG